MTSAILHDWIRQSLHPSLELLCVEAPNPHHHHHRFICGSEGQSQKNEVLCAYAELME